MSKKEKMKNDSINLALNLLSHFNFFISVHNKHHNVCKSDADATQDRNQKHEP